MMGYARGVGGKFSTKDSKRGRRRKADHVDASTSSALSGIESREQEEVWCESADDIDVRESADDLDVRESANDIDVRERSDDVDALVVCEEIDIMAGVNWETILLSLIHI